MRVVYLLFWLIKGISRRLQSIITDYSCKFYSICGHSTYFRLHASIGNFSRVPQKIRIGNGTIIEGKLVVFNYGGSIEIGDNVYVGVNTNIWSGQSVKIGSNVLISHNVNIIDTNSHEIDHIERSERYRMLIKFGHPSNKSTIITGEIIIEDYVWISFGATILKNVRIGKGAIIAANSVVTRNVDSFTMVAGNPAKFVKYLPENSVYEHLKNKKETFK